MVSIFTIFERSKGASGKTTYYMKEDGKSEATVISNSRWFKLYDKGANVLPPLTID